MFFADENIPVPAITYLRSNSFEITSVSESHKNGISDKEVLNSTYPLNAILLTLDSDFGTLIFKDKLRPPLGIVYFRDKGSNPMQIAKWLVQRIRNENLILEGYFTVIEKSGTRQRKL